MSTSNKASKYRLVTKQPGDNGSADLGGRLRSLDELAQTEPYDVTEENGNIGGMVTVGKGVCDAVVIPAGVFVASLSSGARNAFTRDKKNKPHPAGWVNSFYRQPTGTEEQKLRLYCGGIAAKGAMWSGETIGYFVATPFAIGYGIGKELYRAAKTRKEDYAVDIQDNLKSK